MAMKFRKTFLSLSLAALLPITITQPVVASPSGSSQVGAFENSENVDIQIMDTPVIDNALAEKVEPFIELRGSVFFLTAQGKEILNAQETREVEQQLTNTNQLIEHAATHENASQTVGEKSVTFSQPDTKPTDGGGFATFAHGVNSIKIHWWGMEIFLSQTTLRNLGAGAAIAGIWIPASWVARALSTLGVAGTSLVPHGIAFEYHIPTNPLGGWTIRNVRWQ